MLLPKIADAPASEIEGRRAPAAGRSTTYAVDRFPRRGAASGRGPEAVINCRRSDRSADHVTKCGVASDLIEQNRPESAVNSHANSLGQALEIIDGAPPAGLGLSRRRGVLTSADTSWTSLARCGRDCRHRYRFCGLPAPFLPGFAALFLRAVAFRPARRFLCNRTSSPPRFSGHPALVMRCSSRPPPPFSDRSLPVTAEVAASIGSQVYTVAVRKCCRWICGSCSVPSPSCAGTRSARMSIARRPALFVAVHHLPGIVESVGARTRAARSRERRRGVPKTNSRKDAPEYSCLPRFHAAGVGL